MLDRSFVSLVVAVSPISAEIDTLSLHDALPISRSVCSGVRALLSRAPRALTSLYAVAYRLLVRDGGVGARNCEGLVDRKSTRLNSSHANTSYAVFCLKK